MGATREEMFRALLTVTAESDWDPYAKHPTDDTWGLYQQNPRWWGTREQILDPAYATESFVVGRPGTNGLRKITLTDDPVLDCWRVQGWGRKPDGSPLTPDADDAGYAQWLAHPSTQNYVRRLSVVEAMMPSEEPRILTIGGAVTSRGVVMLDTLLGSSPADKLRAAWSSGDRRVIVYEHGTVLDVGSNPIPLLPGGCLAGPGGPQSEFSDQGRLIVRGASAVFRTLPSGSNYSGTKGWSLVNIGFEGQSHLRLIAPNPMDSSGPIIAYASIEGASMDGFHSLIDSPCLGLHMDVRYFNNIYGPYGWRLTGSDCQLWTHGGKGDWGGANSSAPTRDALVVLDGLEKSTIGKGFDSAEFLAALQEGRPMADPETQGGLYLTCSGAAGLEVRGGASRAGLDIYGMTVEGRNAGAPAAGACIRQTGNTVNYWGGNVNYGMGNPGATARAGRAADKAVADITGGRASFYGTKWRRGSYGGPLLARRGTGRVDVMACYEVPSDATVTATNL